MKILMIWQSVFPWKSASKNSPTVSAWVTRASFIPEKGVPQPVSSRHWAGGRACWRAVAGPMERADIL